MVFKSLLSMFVDQKYPISSPVFVSTVLNGLNKQVLHGVAFCLSTWHLDAGCFSITCPCRKTFFLICMYNRLYDIHKYISLRIHVCPKKENTPTFLFFSDGIGTRKILCDREGSGFLGYTHKSGSLN